MGKFLKEFAFRRFFHADEDFSVINIGYDDFSVVKGARAPRVQNCHTWHFVISGKGHLEIGGKVYDLSGGDSFFIPPDTKMCYYPDEKDPWEYVWISLRGKAASDYGERLGFSVSRAACSCRHFGRVSQILHRVIDQLREGSCGYYGVLSAFYELVDLSVSENRPRTAIQSVRDLIDESYSLTDFSVEKLCRDVGFSHAQLLRLFKREYGKTVLRYVIEKRLALACELLERSDLSVRSVALSSGFSDEIHFMKTFKSHKGFTPTEYRERVR